MVIYQQQNRLPHNYPNWVPTARSQLVAQWHPCVVRLKWREGEERAEVLQFWSQVTLRRCMVDSDQCNGGWGHLPLSGDKIPSTEQPWSNTAPRDAWLAPQVGSARSVGRQLVGSRSADINFSLASPPRPPAKHAARPVPCALCLARPCLVSVKYYSRKTLE